MCREYLGVVIISAGRVRRRVYGRVILVSHVPRMSVQASFSVLPDTEDRRESITYMHRMRVICGEYHGGRVLDTYYFLNISGSVSSYNY